MARKPSSRVVLNRKALTQFGEAVADGVEEVMRTIIEVADPPDATPFGEGLVTGGGWLVFNGGKKVGGGSQRSTQPQKPKSERLPATGITGIAGWTFPARFQNNGTVRHAANPFGSRAIAQVTPQVG